MLKVLQQNLYFYFIGYKKIKCLCINYEFLSEICNNHHHFFDAK